MRTTDPPNFAVFSGKPHARIAEELAEEIKEVIYRRAGQIPLATAIGVLRIVEKEILEDA